MAYILKNATVLKDREGLRDCQMKGDCRDMALKGEAQFWIRPWNEEATRNAIDRTDGEI